MAFQTSRLLRHMTYWLLAHRKRELQVDAAVARVPRRRPRSSRRRSRRCSSGSDRERFEESPQAACRLPACRTSLPRASPASSAHNAALDIVELATLTRSSVVEAARVYFEVGARVGLDWLRDQIEQLSVEGPWQAIARTGLRDGALRIHRRLAERVLSRKDKAPAHARVTAWVESVGEELAHWQRTLTEMRAAGASDFATLSVGVESVRKLAD